MSTDQACRADEADIDKLRRHVRILVDLGRLAARNFALDRFLDQAVVQVARAVEIDHVKVMRYRCRTGFRGVRLRGHATTAATRAPHSFAQRRSPRSRGTSAGEKDSLNWFRVTRKALVGFRGGGSGWRVEGIWCDGWSAGPTGSCEELPPSWQHRSGESLGAAGRCQVLRPRAPAPLAGGCVLPRLRQRCGDPRRVRRHPTSSAALSLQGVRRAFRRPHRYSAGRAPSAAAGVGLVPLLHGAEPLEPADRGGTGALRV